MFLCLTFFHRHLLEANDRLKLQVKRLKEDADEKEKDADRFKVKERLKNAGAQTEEPFMHIWCVIFSRLTSGTGMHGKTRQREWSPACLLVCSCEPVSTYQPLILAFTGNKSVSRRAWCWNQDKAVDANNIWSAKLWMKHPRGPPPPVRACLCQAFSSLWICYSCWAFFSTIITLQSRAGPSSLCLHPDCQAAFINRQEIYLLSSLRQLKAA